MKLICLPYNAASLGKREGQEKAPQAVISALKECCINEAGKRPLFEVENIEVDNSDLEAANQTVFQRILQQKERAIILGGDHGLTFSAFKAFVKNNPESGILVFDAHPDMENHFAPPTHEDFLRTLIEEGFLSPEKVIVVGVRNWDIEEYNYIRRKNIRVFTMQQIMQYGVNDVAQTIMESVRQWPSFYLSIDIDVLDPAFAPGTGYREPGGLSTRELLFFVQRLKMLSNYGMADLVEINPTKDVDGITIKTGAKIIMEL